MTTTQIRPLIDRGLILASERLTSPRVDPSDVEEARRIQVTFETLLDKDDVMASMQEDMVKDSFRWYIAKKLWVIEPEKAKRIFSQKKYFDKYDSDFFVDLMYQDPENGLIPLRQLLEIAKRDITEAVKLPYVNFLSALAHMANNKNPGLQEELELLMPDIQQMLTTSLEWYLDCTATFPPPQNATEAWTNILGLVTNTIAEQKTRRNIGYLVFYDLYAALGQYDDYDSLVWLLFMEDPNLKKYAHPKIVHAREDPYLLQELGVSEVKKMKIAEVIPLLDEHGIKVLEDLIDRTVALI